MRVLIGAPLKQKPHIFKEHLESIRRQILPGGVEADLFYVVNDCPEVIPMLGKSEYTVVDEKLESYTSGESDHMWTLADTLKMCALRNRLVDEALRGGYDYLFLVDTDLVLHPLTLAQLIRCDKDIVSEVFWTESDSGAVWCNSWFCDQSTLYEGEYERYKEPGLYQVGMTGACTLIKTGVFRAGVSYAQIPNIYAAFVGEDRHFCVRAACAGFKLYMDTHYPAAHLYREREYQEYMRLKNDAYRENENGAPNSEYGA